MEKSLRKIRAPKGPPPSVPAPGKEGRLRARRPPPSRELLDVQMMLEHARRELAQARQALAEVQAQTGPLVEAKRALEIEVAFLLAQRRQERAAQETRLLRGDSYARDLKQALERSEAMRRAMDAALAGVPSGSLPATSGEGVSE